MFLRVLYWAITSVVLLAWCAVPGSDTNTNHTSNAYLSFSNTYGGANALGVLHAAELDEASGLAASCTYPGILYSHNDSGDTARVFVVDTLGCERGQYYLTGARNRDWEDMAIGPAPDVSQGGPLSYLYLADVGDNWQRRPHISLYRIPEPAYKAGAAFSKQVSDVTHFRFVYPDRAYDCEAILVAPKTGDVYFFTKALYPSRVFVARAPLQRDSVAKLEYLFTLPLARPTAASLTPDGKHVIIKSYQDVYYWHNAQNLSMDYLLQRAPVRLPYAAEKQGEAVALKCDGSGYYTLSELSQQARVPLLYYRRTE